MKRKILGIVVGSIALSLGAVFGVASSGKKAETVSAYYTPSTHYEVSDTASELASYYSSISDSDSGTTLLSKLQSLNSTKRKKTMGYSGIGTDTGGAVIYTDYDLNSTAKDSNGQTYGTKVASFYTKTAATSWNREHMWPNSHGGNNVEGDILHTRPTISSENSSRGNSFYVEGKNSSSSGWDPFTAGYAEWCRGECARVILYCVVAYPSFTLSDADSHSTSNSNKDNMMGNMNTLIKWHFNYLPNVYEKNRNDGAEYLQGNRNPFVDHPEYVARIWSNFNSTVSSLCSSNADTYSNWEPGNYCDFGSNTPVSNDGVTISNSTASVSVGSTTQLSATSSDSGAISWTTSNSSVASISSSSSASGANITITGIAAGTATITAKRTISGTQYSKTCTVTVTKVVSSLSKGSTSPTKTTYTAGESFDPTGLTITATYSDSTSGNVTNSVVWTPDPLTAGTTSVTGTFGGKTITITGLTVNAAAQPDSYSIVPTDLANGTYPTSESSYTAASGISVTAYNTANFSSKLQFKKSGGYLYNNNSLNLGTLTLSGVSGTLTVYAGTAKNPSSTTISGSNGVYNLSGYNYFKIINNSGSVATCSSITVGLAAQQKTLSSISVSSAPTKTTYTAGEYFDPTGLVITRNYSDSTSDTYTYSGHTSEFTFSPSTSTALTTSNVSVTITYGGKSCNQAITVNAASKTLSSISISGQKTSFTVDETFSFGGTVTAHFSDSSSSDVTASATYSGYNMSVAGNYTVTVSYTYGGTNKTTTYSMTVTASGGGGGGTEEGSQKIVSNSGSTYYETGAIYMSTSGDNRTTSCDAFTATWNKNGSSNAIVTTYAEIRIYTSHSFTITPNENYTITSVVLTANNSSYASAVGGSSLTNCTKDVDNVTVTLTPTDGTSAVGFTNTAQSRINYIVVNYEYESSGSSDPITSITASVSKTYYVGETISSSDITVKDNNNKTVTGFTFANNGYQFTYSDASSGGASTNKTFTNSISYESLTCSLTVPVQRKAYATPSPSTLNHTGAEFSSGGIGSSYTEGQSATVDGMMFTVDGYIYNSKLSLSSSKTSAPGKVINVTPYSLGITNVTVSGASPDIQLSTDGSSWVNLSAATTSTVNYYYLKIYYANTSQSNYVNITEINVTVKGAEDALNVSNYIMYADTDNQCTTKLSVATGYLSSLSETQLTLFQTSEDYVILNARTRLEAWARNQGKTINYTVNNVTASAVKVITLINSGFDLKTAIVVILSSAATISLVAGYFLLRRRKEEK